ncbi:MAG: hypothetical protein GXP48_01020 [Acidobacteria bacterium]|nr:hypothetical protein [Acidobacteriota bacterium]
MADIIPPELQRIVELLNEQMDPAEVPAVEIRRYAWENVQTLVPRVLGQSAQSERRKGAGWTPGSLWTEGRLLAELEEQGGAAAVAVARRLYSWARQRGLELGYGRGRTEGSVTFGVRRNGESFWPVVLLSTGKVGVQLMQLMYHSPFDSEEIRKEVLRRLNEIEGVSFDASFITRRPSLSVEELSSGARLEDFLGVADWILGQIKNPGPGVAG